ncbi:craniofacial development protein 2-like [Galleria mellonella]|uniref:Craniofacial development protein 2-like n=1 Tax=Galleria mellonella TaxID=7137 RepID=A0A6J3BZG1_GALME|nr:craniofacial development protein 2-like [Galleria mellonella]
MKPSIRVEHRIGTWNVRGLLMDGKLSIIEDEIDKHKISILGLSETHIKGSGHFKTTTGNTMYFSGHEADRRNGVGFIVPAKLTRFVTGYNPINDRIMTIRLKSKPCLLNIIQVYAPTAAASQEATEIFYRTLETIIQRIPKREMLIVQGDWNAKIGNSANDDQIRHILGKHGLGIRNERGKKFIEFCIGNSLTITNSCFKYHNRRLYTWRSPGDRYRNQIDYIIINERWRSSITNVRTFPSSDCGSDHQLLVANLRLCLKSLHKPPKQMKRHAPSEISVFRRKTENKFLQQPYTVTQKNTNANTQWQRLQSQIAEVLDSMLRHGQNEIDKMRPQFSTRIRSCKTYADVRETNFSRRSTRK